MADVYVSRSKEKSPVAAQAHRAILERYGIKKCDLKSAHTEKSWRWKVISAEGRRKVAAKNGSRKPAADKAASTSTKGGTTRAAKPAAAVPRRIGGVTVPEHAFEGGGKGYLMLRGGKGRRATTVQFFATISEARRQAASQASRMRKGNVVLVQVLNAVTE